MILCYILKYHKLCGYTVSNIEGHSAYVDPYIYQSWSNNENSCLIKIIKWNQKGNENVTLYQFNCLSFDIFFSIEETGMKYIYKKKIIVQNFVMAISHGCI